ncbi:MAG: glycogen debranching enzyme GlgX [Spirochaetes bacterium GWF1_51_8]|nr:MAG: glycogen debranching enzyme GlgX [Spirochaetes bacterium GWF1_51_8]
MAKTFEIDGMNTEAGNPYLLGATVTANGCNFALFSRHASGVTLLLFNSHTALKPTHTITLDPRRNKTGDVWHIFVHDIIDGQYYGYMVDGPYKPLDGHRFNANKLLIDPYTTAIGGEYYWNETSAYGYDRSSPEGDLSFSAEKNINIKAKSMVVDESSFDWDDDKPLQIPMNDTIIYETHVRSLTRHDSSGVKHPGTYLGVIDMIPYLRDLGITTLELLPVQHFNELENFHTDPVTGEPLKNYWGYSTLAFFAPCSWYASDRVGITAVREFKEMVKALHQAGIELIIDVVYNHTGEGNEYGPTLSFRGLDNRVYYMLDHGRYYHNYSGCGNTLNCNHPVVKRLILDSLRYWVVDMHVDGFRFDLAAILGRDEHGNWMPNYSILTEISRDPILSTAKIIAEGWDAAGLYTVGGFPFGWAEWNGKFRDTSRSFIKGDPGVVPDIAKRLSGSADLFEQRKGNPYHSINFITAHDGFTLSDLVTYNEKHNERNGEGNGDGENQNLSWNCGAEGPTGDPAIGELRLRQMKNFMLMLMVSQGTPMLLGGDEIGFSKKGNNNTYCHDNELNWIDWGLKQDNKELFEFTRFMIRFRKKHPALRREHFFTGLDLAGNELPDISWHGLRPGDPDWSHESRVLAFMLDGATHETGASEPDNDIYIAFNSHWDEQLFILPAPVRGKKWHLAIDTFSRPGFASFGNERVLPTNGIRIKPRSAVILIDK